MKQITFILTLITLLTSSVTSGQTGKQLKELYIIKFPNGQVRIKGYRIIPDSTVTNMAQQAILIGLWEEWYENGNKKLEVFYGNSGELYQYLKIGRFNDMAGKYINMWLPDGTQILKNGNGYYFDDKRFVWEIKDSTITGKEDFGAIPHPKKYMGEH